jgi:hypothetical protein
MNSSCNGLANNDAGKAGFSIIHRSGELRKFFNGTGASHFVRRIHPQK